MNVKLNLVSFKRVVSLSLFQSFIDYKVIYSFRRVGVVKTECSADYHLQSGKNTLFLCIYFLKKCVRNCISLANTLILTSTQEW